MALDERFEEALHSSEPVQRLRSLAKSFLAQGLDKTSVFETFEGVRQQLRQVKREADEEAVVDVLDCLVGWCGPHMDLGSGTAAST
jgi:hypothetical protein